MPREGLPLAARPLQLHKDYMRFADITGNADVCRALAGMVDSGRVPHALMLHEDDGGGAFIIGLAFLQYLYCRQHKDGDSCDVCPTCNKLRKMIHPDVRFVWMRRMSFSRRRRRCRRALRSSIRTRRTGFSSGTMGPRPSTWSNCRPSTQETSSTVGCSGPSPAAVVLKSSDDAG